MVLGITGSSATGKSTLAEYFVRAGWKLIDLDHFGHQALHENKPGIVRVFGNSILDSYGNIDRKKLGAIVFRSTRDRLALETIVHPYMVDQVARTLKNTAEWWVIDAALLFYMKLDTLCDTIFYLKTPLYRRVWRLLRREKSLKRMLHLLLVQRGLFAQFDASLSDVQNVYCIQSDPVHNAVVKQMLEQKMDTMDDSS